MALGVCPEDGERCLGVEEAELEQELTQFTSLHFEVASRGP